MKKEKKLKREKTRRFPRIYIIDVIIILLVIAIGFGIYFRYSVYDTFGNSKNQVEAVVSFSISNINETTGYYIDIDDAVYFKDSGDEFGRIMPSSDNSLRAIEDEPAIEVVEDNGEYITVSYPMGTRIDAKGRIKCKGIFGSDGAFMLNGSDYMAPGQTFTVCTEKVTVNITVLDIQALS